MKKSLLFLIFLFTGPLWAQQSLFNTPSSQQTEKGKHFAQEQLNFIHPLRGVNNFTYDYGLSENIEVGFNVLGLSNLKRYEGSENLDVMANAQYFYKFSDDLQFSIAGQAGISHHEKFAYYTFVNMRKNLFSSAAYVVVGAFIANDHYLEYGHGNWHFGTEIPIIEEKLHFIADYVNGDTSISVGVVGLGYFVDKDWMISLGAQYPSFQSKNEHGAVFEITYNPSH